MTWEQIACVVGKPERTLRRACKAEYNRGKPDAIAKVAASLFQLTQQGNVAACIFWLKTQARWRETDHAEDGPAEDSAQLALA